MRSLYGLVISGLTVLALVGCGGGTSSSGSGGSGPGGEQTEADIVAEAIQIAIDRTLVSCTVDSISLMCLDATFQGTPVLADNDTIERIGCGWNCLPVPTNDGGERFVRLSLIWERFVDQCYDPADRLVIFAFEQPILCTPNF